MQVAYRVHAAVGVDLEAPEEPVGVLLQRPERIAALVLGERDAEHALLDAEPVHLLEQEPDRIVARLGVRDVLEHVLRGELELVERLVVAQALAQELVRPRTGAKGRGDHQIDHADVGRHGHARLLGTGVRTVAGRIRREGGRNGTRTYPGRRDRSDPYDGVREVAMVPEAASRPREWGPMNLKTAALRLGVHYQTAYRWVRSGQLVAVKVGAGYEISEAAVARLQAQRAATERMPEGAAPSGRASRDRVERR